MTFNNPFSSFDYSKATPIFQDKKNGNLYYCNTETVDLPSYQSLLKEKILCSTSERIKKMKFNIEQLNFRQFKNLFSEQTTEAQKFENVAARLNEATQLTDRFKSNVDVVKSSELPQADQLSRSMPKLSGGNPIGRNIKIDRLKPLPSGGESKINDSQSTQSDLDPLDVLEVQLSEIVKKIRTAENELAAPLIHHCFRYQVRILLMLRVGYLIHCHIGLQKILTTGRYLLGIMLSRFSNMI